MASLPTLKKQLKMLPAIGEPRIRRVDMLIRLLGMRTCNRPLLLKGLLNLRLLSVRFAPVS